MREALAAPERLRVFRREPSSGRGVDAGVPPGSIEIADFDGGKGIAFPITLFGTYAVFLERPR